MSRRQKGKGGKRLKRWHRGKGEAERWQRVDLPDTGVDADPTAAHVEPVRNRPGKRYSGEALA